MIFEAVSPPSQPVIVRGGRVVDPSTGEDRIRDLVVSNGRIGSSLSAGQEAQARILEASGCIVCPGLVDIHTHLREPGQTQKETIQTGSWAAAAGGFTSIVCMPNTQPPADHPGTIQYIRDAIQREAVVRVYPTGCITQGGMGEKLAPIGSLHRAGVVAITDDGGCVQKNELMRRAVEYAHMFGLPVLDHCQDASLTEGSVMHEGLVSLKLGLRGWPAAAEDIMVSRNVILSTHTGAHIHLQHITSATSVDIIRRAKQRGVSVTAEVTPHHLALTDRAVEGYDSNFKMNPPLRSEEDRRALMEGLQDGTIDCIATDHAPHTNYEKDVEFDYAPFGVVGLETALAVVLEQLYRPGHLGLLETLALLTCRPAAILNLEAGTLRPGARADVTVFSPDQEWTPSRECFFSKSYNSPWLGQSLRGKVLHTIVGGHLVYSNGHFPSATQTNPSGQ